MERAILSRLNGDITEWNRTRLNKQLASIRSALEKVYAGVADVVREQVMALADYEVGFEVKALGNVLSGYDFNLPSDAQLRTAIYSKPLQAAGPYQGQLLEGFLEGWSKQRLQRLDGAIRLAYAQGRTTGQLVSDLNGVGGWLGTSRRDLESIARTALAHTTNMARQQTWDANRNVVKGVRIVATLDDATSQTCRSLDGKEFPLDKGPRPPFHIRCRTTTTAVLDSRFSVLQKGATRSARDPRAGEVVQVPAKETYYSWMKRQPKAVQDDILGPTRGKLLRNGGLGADRFAELQVGKSFEPLTLEQMRNLEPLAFTRAGID